jgi:hypothetical protein
LREALDRPLIDHDERIDICHGIVRTGAEVIPPLDIVSDRQLLAPFLQPWTERTVRQEHRASGHLTIETLENAVCLTVVQLVSLGVARPFYLDSLDDFVVQLDREVNYVIVARNPLLQKGSWLDVQRNCRYLAEMVA